MIISPQRSPIPPPAKAVTTANKTFCDVSEKGRRGRSCSPTRRVSKGVLSVGTAQFRFADPNGTHDDFSTTILTGLSPTQSLDRTQTHDAPSFALAKTQQHLSADSLLRTVDLQPDWNEAAATIRPVDVTASPKGRRISATVASRMRRSLSRDSRKRNTNSNEAVDNFDDLRIGL